MIPVFSIVAYSGTGKTTFMEKLIPALKKHGLRVAVIKHDAHKFEIDKEGKDSYRITQAGADVTGLICDQKAVIMENRYRSPLQIIEEIKEVDLILTEGYKTGSWPKIMLHRQATGKDLPVNPADCLAVVSDVPVEGARHLFSLEDADGVAHLIMEEMQTNGVSHPFFHQKAIKRYSNPLFDIPFLQNVKKETLDGLWKDGKVIELPKKTLILQARKSKEDIYIQLSGKSSVYSLTHTGQRKVIFIFGEGILLNDHVFHDHLPSYFCETMEKSQLFVISKSRFVFWMEKDFSLTQSVTTMQEWKMWRMGHQLKNTTGSIYMERKLAAKLWKLARDFGKNTKDGVEIDLNLSITFLSDMLGAPRETTSRLCKTLSDYGLISIQKKRITITDIDGMSRLYREGKILE